MFFGKKKNFDGSFQFESVRSKILIIQKLKFKIFEFPAKLLDQNKNLTSDSNSPKNFTYPLKF